MTFRRHTQNLLGSTFFMNALYLMFSTFAVAVLGVVFWVEITQTYNVTDVGLATTLISVSGLISLLSLAGFDITFVRFLPNSTQKNDYINTGLIVAALVSAILSAAFSVIVPLLVPDLSILNNPWAFTGFVFFTIASTLNILTNAVFMAFKDAWYILVVNIVFNLLKVALPLFVAAGDAMTIFTIAGSTQLVGLVLSIVYMKRKFGYVFSPRVHTNIMRKVRKFSSSVYVSSILNLLPPTLLPLVVVNQIGAPHAAYYYMALTIAGALYTIAYASMQSVFAESSHNESAMSRHVAKATKLVIVVLLPAAIAIIALSNFLLETFFGAAYAQEASPLLQLFALSALPVALYSALGAIFKVTQNLRGIVVMNVTYAVVILSLSYILTPTWGLIAIGWAWLFGNLAAGGAGLLFLRKQHLLKGRWF